MAEEPEKTQLLPLVTQIVAAHVSHNPTTPDALPALIKSVFATLSGVGMPEVVAAKAEPKVPVKRSVFSDHIVCLDCGRSLKTLKRHLASDHDTTPGAYREKWGLPRDYPMVAPGYSAKRSALAKELGLGRKAAPTPKVTVVPEGKRGRKKKAA